MRAAVAMRKAPLFRGGTASYRSSLGVRRLYKRSPRDHCEIRTSVFVNTSRCVRWDLASIAAGVAGFNVDLTMLLSFFLFFVRWFT